MGYIRYRKYDKGTSGKYHYETRYNVTRGTLKGRTYKTESGYRRALAKLQSTEIRSEARYIELWTTFMFQKGVRYAKKHRARFEELYKKAKRTDFNECPPANDVGVKGAPYAYLLDLIGVRPVEEFGWICIGDTPKA